MMAPKAGAPRSKRKRATDGDEPQKRRRSVSSDEDEGEDPKTEILLMEQGILESKKNYNDISVLIETASGYEEDAESALLASVALCRVFIGLTAQESLTVRRSHSEREQVVVRWLKEQLSAYRAVLLELLAAEEFSETALTLCMRLLKAEGERMSTKEDYTFPNQFLQSIVSALLEVDDDGVRKTYMEEYAEGFDDLRYFTFKSIR